MIDLFVFWAACSGCALVGIVIGVLAARAAFLRRLRRMRAVEAANQALVFSLDASTMKLNYAAKLMEIINKRLLEHHPEAAASVRDLTSKSIH